MVEPGSIVADVGCDHGYVSMYLIRQGICPRVLAMDVNRGPLERAAEHVEQAGLSAYIDLRLSDGLKAMGWRNCGGTFGQSPQKENGACSGNILPEKNSGVPGNDLVPEADTLLTAGLGGRLAARILEDSADKVSRMKWAILQPQSEIWLVRQTLRKMGYRITVENMIFEEGKYYTVIKARNEWFPDTVPMTGWEGADGRADSQEIGKESALGLTLQQRLTAADLYGAYLIENRHPVLRDYLMDTLRKNRQIAEKIRREMNEVINNEAIKEGKQEGETELSSKTGNRLAALEQEIKLQEKILAWMQ